jgi:hypothetical protein
MKPWILIVGTKDGEMNRYLITTRHNIIQLQRINNLVWYNLKKCSEIFMILLTSTFSNESVYDITGLAE